MVGQKRLFKDEKFFSTTQDEQWLELLKKYDMGSEMIFTANDLEMWLRILMKFHIGILHKKLMFYRVHAGQGTQQVQATSYENFFIVIDYYARYARTNNLILGKNWKCYEAKKVRWEFAKGMRALMRDEFSFARKFFMNFIKKFQLLVPDLKLKDFFRFLWAWCVIFSGPFAYKLKKTVHMYFLYKNRKENKKVRIF